MKEIIVISIFLLVCISIIVLIIKKPYFYIKIIGKKQKNNNIKVETFWIAAITGPILLFATGLLNIEKTLTNLTLNSSINPIQILILFLSMVFLSIYLDRTGFFEYCARLSLKIAKKSQHKLFLSLYITVSILTIFTSNDIIILTFTPFIYYFTKAAKINPIPYLVSEFFAANTWSMMLYIGNPTNIYLASAYGLTFFEYTKWMILPTIAAGITSLTLLYIIFKKDLSKNLKISKNADKQNDPKKAIKDKPGLIIGLSHMGGCIILLSIAPYINIPMWILSFAFAVSLSAFIILRHLVAHLKNPIKRKSTKRMEKILKLKNKLFAGKVKLKKKETYPLCGTINLMPWSIVPFVISMFIMVFALNTYGITDSIGKVLQNASLNSSSLLAIIYGFISAISCNLINNIPMTVSFANIMSNLIGQPQNLNAAIYATVIGSNLGACITPIGALAGIMWMNILKEKKIRFSFLDFMRYGVVITFITLAACLLVLALEFKVF